VYRKELSKLSPSRIWLGSSMLLISRISFTVVSYVRAMAYESTPAHAQGPEEEGQCWGPRRNEW